MESKLKIKDLPQNERPYEKMEKYGPQSLSNAELMAVIIRTGSKNETSVSLCQRILSCDTEGKGLAFLNDLSLEELRGIHGVGRVKAIQIKALVELSKRTASISGLGNRIIIKSPEDVSRAVMGELRYLGKEVFKMMLLNTKNHVMKCMEISVGSLTSSIVHPREVFREAIKAGCAGVIFIHNHPSGEPEPSAEDIETTKRLVNAGDILGIKVLDHIIIGDGRYVSLKENGLM